MGLSKRCWLLAAAILIVGSTSVFAQQPRVQLVQGRRAVKDKVTFVVEVLREKNGSSSYAKAPEDIFISTRFTDHAATGMVYLDGKPLGRFDEAMSFNSNPNEITYGRHTITMVLASPAIVFDFTVMVRGGVAREILEGEQPAAITGSTVLEQRIVELERKVDKLQAEIATLKKN